jgi:hypothetical protein
MTSPTDKSKNVRRAKRSSLGRKQKNKILRDGTTPKLLTLDRPVTPKKG